MEYVKEFLERYEFPEESKVCLLSVFEQLMKSEKAKELFFLPIERFCQEEDQDYDKVFESLKRLANQICVHEFTIQLLFLICKSTEQ